MEAERLGELGGGGGAPANKVEAEGFGELGGGGGGGGGVLIWRQTIDIKRVGQ